MRSEVYAIRHIGLLPVDFCEPIMRVEGYQTTSARIPYPGLGNIVIIAEPEPEKTTWTFLFTARGVSSKHVIPSTTLAMPIGINLIVFHRNMRFVSPTDLFIIRNFPR